MSLDYSQKPVSRHHYYSCFLDEVQLRDLLQFPQVVRVKSKIGSQIWTPETVFLMTADHSVAGLSLTCCVTLRKPLSHSGHGLLKWEQRVRSEFLNPHTCDLGTRSFFVVEGCPARYRMLSGFPDLCPLDASLIPTWIVIMTDVSRHCQTSLVGGKVSPG